MDESLIEKQNGNFANTIVMCCLISDPNAEIFKIFFEIVVQIFVYIKTYF